MAYFAPFIDAAGLHIPTYPDIRDFFVSEAQRIFGQDIYLGNDSQDYEYISIVSDKIYDTLLTAQLVYNNRSPASAIGAALDGLVLINGIRRKIATYSRFAVRLIGTPGTAINNGAIRGVNGNRWNLPVSITLGTNGQATTYVTAQQPGPLVLAAPLTIDTPTLGWESADTITGPDYPFYVGSNIESDVDLRGRQKVSTARPSRTVFEGTMAAVMEVIGVTRVRGYENDTSITDANTVPPHSIAMIVENGNNTDIATAIYLHKGPGCGTYGDVSTTIYDVYEQPITINFWRPQYVPISVIVSIRQLTNYTTALESVIQQNVADYVNSVRIGDNLSVSAVWGAAQAANPSQQQPAFSITQVLAGAAGNLPSVNDIAVLFNQAVQGDTANVTIQYV